MERNHRGAFEDQKAVLERVMGPVSHGEVCVLVMSEAGPVDEEHMFFDIGVTLGPRKQAQAIPSSVAGKKRFLHLESIVRCTRA